jgi:hypothetical protein
MIGFGLPSAAYGSNSGRSAQGAVSLNDLVAGQLDSQSDHLYFILPWTFAFLSVTSAR